MPWPPGPSASVGADRWSVSNQRGALFENPLLNRWAPPLVSGVVDESLWYGVAKHDQALQHHRQIDIRDGPVVEKVVGAALEQVTCRSIFGPVDSLRQWPRREARGP